MPAFLMNPTKDIHRTGERGEAIALHYLRRAGLEILARNYRRGKAEIDIIAREGSFLAIIEVKSRGDNHYGPAEEAVDRVKVEQMTMAAGHYQESFHPELEIRFDIITVYFPGGKKAQLTHIRDAFHG